jgi:23S rRNA (uracil1939-C5)-methyltransferase
MELQIESLAFGGDGVARHAGKVWFVPFTIPGEKVRVEVVVDQKKFGRAQLVEVLSPSPSREKPLCAVYEKCGGCQYQHLSYEEELNSKTKQVEETLRRIGKLIDPPVKPIIRSPQPYGYRNRIVLHRQNGVWGFRGTNPRELVGIQSCPIASEVVNQELEKFLKEPDQKLDHVSIRDPQISRSGFHQANSDLAEVLIYLVGEYLPPKAGALVEGYCGGGFFTEKLSDRFDSIYAIEKDERLLRDADRLKLPNVTWVHDSVEICIQEALLESEAKVVLVDPPREGLESGIVSILNRSQVEDLVYVSCNPSTLARDAHGLSEMFDLKVVQPLDLFPRTSHIECVTQWKRK